MIGEASYNKMFLITALRRLSHDVAIPESGFAGLISADQLAPVGRT